MRSSKMFVIISGIGKHGGILRHGRRDEAVEETDSGWQFSTEEAGDNRIEDAEVWSLDELTKYDISISDFIDAPLGAVARRSSVSAPWTVEID